MCPGRRLGLRSSGPLLGIFWFVADLFGEVFDEPDLSKKITFSTLGVLKLREK